LHRDLKPDNIALTEGDFVKILDFGLAKLADLESTQLTNSGFALGTPAYMSPEQARGRATDERTDIYAVGVLLYQMLVGTKPFVAEEPIALLRMQMDDAPIPPRQAAPNAHLSAALEAAILRAMEKDPNRRFASAEAFSRALSRAPEGGGSLDDVAFEKTQLALSTHSVELPVPGRSRRWFALAALAGLVAVGGYTWSKLSRRAQHRVTQHIDEAVVAAKDVAKDVAKDTARVLVPPVDTPPKEAAPADPDLVDTPEPAGETPGKRLEASANGQPSAGKKPATLALAIRLLNADKVDEAISVLYVVRRQMPRSAETALFLGHAYFRKMWRTDALREYDHAIELRPALRRNAGLLHNLVVALDDPTYRPARGLAKRVGAAAIPELRRAARADKSQKVRKRAALLLHQLTR
jgi:serine/threonine-protein kinase